MSKSEPVNLFAIGGERFPHGANLLEAMSYLHATFQALWPALHKVTEHAGQTSLGMNADGTPVTDDELAFHHLAGEQIEESLEALLAKTKQLLTISKERIWNTVTNRHSMGMVALGKTFTCGGDVIPKMPKEDTTEYAELMRWIKDNGYGDKLYPEGISFKPMQQILDDRAANHLPRPPHVSTYPTKTVTVKKA